jgi:alpha-amylase/alpha-mannosidase (GH57 family)
MGYVCIHGHFYQPPRENPWLEAIELQDSAYPYHDWNERVTAECYAPNSAARILNTEQRILRILNNFERISFNFGPTLLSWLEIKSPKVYRAILQADHASKDRFSGHGSAIAQAYHHIIMPLANERDKHTQVAWGIRDFEHRFGRFPEGMWLPETAVDIETLEILAKFEISFTILAPRQARQEGKIGGRSWKDVSGERIDPSMPYRLNLPSGRKISIFFYDGPISRAVAFEDLLANGEGFAKRLMAGFAEDLRPWPELVHIATDGETYGHHHRFGEMALASALAYIESNQLAQITNYGEYLERHPPIHRVEIQENTSWSCIHGIERWRSNCGCNSGGHNGWNQEWRRPLREALDWLRDTLAPKYEKRAQELLKDAWAARNEYVDVVLDRSNENVERFLKKHAVHELDSNERVVVLKLLELQRHAMLMYTSCGWFFDEVSGIEAVQVLHYAGRVVELAEQVFGDRLEADFLERLAKAKSNIPEHGDGARIYNTLVKPSRVDLLTVGGHYAVNSLFEAYGEHAELHCYAVDREENFCRQSGTAKLVIGKARFTSTITQESTMLGFGAVHLGKHHLIAGVRAEGIAEADRARLNDLIETFSQDGKNGEGEIRSCLKQVFGNVHSLEAVFRDEQRKVLSVLADSVLAEIDRAHREVYERHAEFMRFLSSCGMPLPKTFQSSARPALNSFLRDALAADELSRERIHSLLEEVKALDIILDAATLGLVLKKRIEKMAEAVAADVADVRQIEQLAKAVALARSLPFAVDLWWVQTLCHEWIEQAYGGVLLNANAGDKSALAWTSAVAELSEQLLFLHPREETVQSLADGLLSKGVQSGA